MDGQQPNLEPSSIPLERVEGAYLELQSHNDEHTGLGRAMGGLLSALIREEGELGGEDYRSVDLTEGRAINSDSVSFEERTEPTHLEKGELSKDLLHFTVDPVFEACGLSRLGKDAVFTSGFQVTSERQGVAIVHPTKFLELLQRSSGQLERYPGLSRLYGEAYQTAIFAITNLSKSSEGISDTLRQRALEVQLDILSRIYPEYVKLVGNGEIEGINLEIGQAYINWGEKPEFEDFIKARELGIREKNTFSASEWHLDSSREYYQDKWTDLLGHYDKVIQKWGEDSDLAVLVRAEMQDAIDDAKVWLSKGGYDESYNASLQVVVDSVATQLASRQV